MRTMLIGLLMVGTAYGGATLEPVAEGSGEISIKAGKYDLHLYTFKPKNYDPKSRNSFLFFMASRAMQILIAIMLKPLPRKVAQSLSHHFSTRIILLGMHMDMATCWLKVFCCLGNNGHSVWSLKLLQRFVSWSSGLICL